jgi:hypothetical protein
VPAPVLSAIQVAADSSAWAGAGFSVTGEALVVGGVTIDFVDGGQGIVDWELVDGDPPGTDGPAHANGVTEIDHVVMLAPRLEPTIATLEDEGIELRRIREGETGMGRYRQAFFRVGRPILEVVEAADMDEGEPARFWGITFTTADIDAASELLGDKLGGVKGAVQPGRRIATVRQEAGLGLPVALISPKA